MILVLNTGSTSTKVAVYSEQKALFCETIRHASNQLSDFSQISEQLHFRMKLILDIITKHGYKLKDIKIIMARGGMLKPIPSGVYEISYNMLEDLKEAKYGEHASNLGALIANILIQNMPHTKAYITDPVVVDELQPVARISGNPAFERKSVFHALNQKSIAITYAQSINKPYEQLNLIVVHMGGGISVGAHHHGKVIDVNQALNGEGPMSAERSGTVPLDQLVKLCFSGKASYNNVMKMICGAGGYAAYLGTNDGAVVEQRASNGDAKAKLIRDALIYQTAKEIGASATVLKGKVDAILITGGMAYSQQITDDLSQYISFIAPIHIYPGEDEMSALAMSAQRVLNGEIHPKVYV